MNSCRELLAAIPMEHNGKIISAPMARIGVRDPVYSRTNMNTATGSTAVPMKWPMRPTEKAM